MANTEVPEWNPSSQEDKMAKDAFNELNTSNDKVVIQIGTKEDANQFILHSKGYFGEDGWTFPM